VLEYRITKYDPAARLEGRPRTEWTAFSDIGRTFGAGPLTQAAYEAVEAAYVAAAVSFMREAGVSCLAVRGLEGGAQAPLPCREGETLALDQAARLMAGVLRELCWCRLESPLGFVHFGWDYYMYVGVASPCPDAARRAAEAGLFVEEMRSPHHPRQR
jgi:hypothetical protein